MNPTAIFLMQAFVSLCLVMFSIGMLASQRGDTSVYLPLLSATVSAWLPSPQPPKGLLSALGGPGTLPKSIQDIEKELPLITEKINSNFNSNSSNPNSTTTTVVSAV